MRFMMMAMPKAYESAAPDAMPGTGAVTRMMEYNKSLRQAGVLLALDRLLPPSTGARISFLEGKAIVANGLDAEAKEAIERYWIIQARTREEAIEWARRAPMSNNEIIEVRQIHELGDSPENVEKADEGFRHPSASAASNV